MLVIIYTEIAKPYAIIMLPILLLLLSVHVAHSRNKKMDSRVEGSKMCVEEEREKRMKQSLRKEIDLTTIFFC